MNQAAFDDKLKNFKTVRSADFYKPRSQRTKVTTSSSSVAKAAGKGKEAGTVGKAAKSAGVFGEIEALCEKSLPPAELAKFMQNLRAVHATSSRRVNLNDLETLCS